MKRLVILQLDDIGDYIIFTDSLRFYRRLYPAGEWRITLIGFSSWADLVSPRIGDWIDEFIPFNHGRFRKNQFYRFAMIRRLCNLKADLLLNPNIIRTELMDFAAEKIKAPRKVGWVRERLGTNLSQNQGDENYTELFELKMPQHELDVHRAFLARLGYRSPDGYKTEAIWSKADSQEVDTIIGDEKFIIITPYSGHYFKDWPTEKMNEVVDWLAPKYCIYYLGDKKQARAIEQNLRRIPGRTVNLAGRLNLQQAAYLTSRAALAISNDSMNAHMALAVGAPLVAILSEMHRNRFFPYPGKNERLKVATNDWDCFNCFWNCKYPTNPGKPAPCVAEIDVAVVKKLSGDLLK